MIIIQFYDDISNKSIIARLVERLISFKKCQYI